MFLEQKDHHTMQKTCEKFMRFTAYNISHMYTQTDLNSWSHYDLQPFYVPLLDIRNS